MIICPEPGYKLTEEFALVEDPWYTKYSCEGRSSSSSNSSSSSGAGTPLWKVNPSNSSELDAIFQRTTYGLEDLMKGAVFDGIPLEVESSEVPSLSYGRCLRLETSADAGGPVVGSLNDVLTANLKVKIDHQFKL